MNNEQKPVNTGYTLPKIKITITAEIEYEANPESYPGCRTWEEMLKVDLENDPVVFLESCEMSSHFFNTKYSMTGEIIN